MSFTAHLPLSGDRVRLRTLRYQDAADYTRGTTDPDVRRFGHLPEPEYTPRRVRELIDTEIATGLETGSLAVLALAAAADDSLLGSLVLFDVTADSVEIGFWLLPEARGRGAATAGLELGKALAAACGLQRLGARTVVANHASRAVLERAGFVPQGPPVSGTAPSGDIVELQEYLAET